MLNVTNYYKKKINRFSIILNKDRIAIIKHHDNV